MKERKEEFYQFWTLLGYPKHGLADVRAIDVNAGTMLARGFFDDPDRLFEKAVKFDGVANLYLGRNPRSFRLKQSESYNTLLANSQVPVKASKQIEFINAISLDIDPVREKNTPSTEEDHQLAVSTAEEIAKRYGNTFVIDSGNGAQLVFILPVIKVENRKALELIIKSWEEEMRDEIESQYKGKLMVDPSFDLARILKLPGFLSVKGVATAERPYRRARITYVAPDIPASCSKFWEELLDKVAQIARAGQLKKEHPKLETVPVKLSSRLETILVELLHKDPKFKLTWEGHRNNTEPGLGYMPDITGSGYDQSVASLLVKHQDAYELTLEEIAAFIYANPYGKQSRGHTVSKNYIQRTIDSALEYWKKQGEEQPTSIYLLDIEKEALDGRQVQTEFILSGEGTTYGVPQEFTCSCNKVESCNIEDCPLKGTSTLVTSLSRDDRRLLNFYKQGDYQLKALLRVIAKVPKCAKVQVDKLFTLKELILEPRVQEIKGDSRIVTETGRDYRSILGYYVGDLDYQHSIFSGIGIATHEPKRQEKTVLFSEITGIDAPWQKFRLDNDTIASFKRLQCDKKDVSRKIWSIARDVTDNITRRFGKHRIRTLICELLVLHSCLKFNFDQEEKNGWLEILVLGDTGTGKTSQIENLLRAVELGQLVSGSTSSRTGLLYDLDTKFNGRRILKWGALPRNNGGLVVIDESHKIPISDWSQLTDARDRGFLKVERSVKAQHPVKVRKIFLANPVEDQPVSSFYCGIEAVRGLMRSEDMRRFDLVIIASKDDHGEQEINKLSKERTLVEQLITPALLRASICWAWSLEAEQISFTEEAEGEVMRQASFLSQKYGSALDIPLLITDTKDKIARFAVAVAVLIHSTSDHKQVMVEKEYVEFIGSLFDEVYSHPNCRLDEYAMCRKQETSLSRDEYLEVKEVIKQLQDGSLDKDWIYEFLNFFRRNEIISLSELASELTLGRGTISVKMADLKRVGLIRSSRNGYHRTPKLIAFLREEDNCN